MTSLIDLVRRAGYPLTSAQRPHGPQGPDGSGHRFELALLDADGRMSSRTVADDAAALLSVLVAGERDLHLQLRDRHSGESVVFVLPSGGRAGALVAQAA